MILKSVLFVNSSKEKATNSSNDALNKKRNDSTITKQNRGNNNKKKLRSKSKNIRPIDKKANFTANFEYFCKDMERLQKHQSSKSGVHKKMINYFQKQKSMVKGDTSEKGTKAQESDTEEL